MERTYHKGDSEMKNFLLASTLLAAVGVTPAYATLQLSITADGQTFTCSDGELSCDQSGGANNLLTINTSIGGAFVQLTLTQATFGATNELELSASSIVNQSGAPLTISLEASDTGFVNPVTHINDSGSLTFNDAVGSGQSSLAFFADHANGQGAPGTPGTLLEQVFGAPLTDPDSFAGSNDAAFLANAPFSMTEQANLTLISGGSITGFNQSMTSSAVPEPSTWALLGIGFATMALAGVKRRKAYLKGNRLATFA
jgi:hypothetical protein